MTVTGSAPEFLVVGRIARAHGLAGEVQVEVLTDFPELRFVTGGSLWLGPERGGEPRLTELTGVRQHRDRLIVHLDGAIDRTAADALRGLLLYVKTEDAAELDADAYWIHELVGLEVVHVDGQSLGHVKSVMETGATEILVVQPPETTDARKKDILLPMIGEIIVSVDVAGGRIVVAPLEGMVD